MKCPTLDDHRTVRAAFPALQEVVYLNIGTYGIMPQPALDAFVEALVEFEQYGVGSRGGLGQKVNQTRQRIADLLGCAVEQITLTGNATEGTNLVLSGIEWEPGDEVLTTNEEHESIIHPLLHLQRCRGVRMRRLPVSPDPESMVARLEAASTPRTRLVAFSHVTCESGTRLPSRAICDWARERSILSLVDCAQSLGALRLDMASLGCDFFTSNGHKWLCGPKGTGIFAARPDSLLGLCPAHVGAGSLQRANAVDGTADLWSTGRRFEFGTRASALYAGLGESLKWLEGLGWENIEAYVACMSDALKECVLERAHLELLTPRRFDQSSGLVTFVVKGHEAGEVSRQLHEMGDIVVRVIAHYNAIRISTPFFVNEQDMDKLVGALDEIAS